MNKKLIYVVEDESPIQELIKYNVTKENYLCEVFETAEAMLSKVEKTPPSIILLDIMLPGMDGFEACRSLKMNETTAEIPVIMLTAKGEEIDVVTG
ncbi:MAG: response regulator, partial [Fibrobacterota bacterium]